MTTWTKFVLLSAARSGSSLVVETLNSHPSVIAHGEIFHEDLDTHIRPEFRETHDLSLRERDPVGFVDAILGFPAGRSAVGFKIWEPQSRLACDYILAAPDIVKIILERENCLAHYTSIALAQQTGVWNVRNDFNTDIKIPAGPLRFSVREFHDFIAYHKRIFDYYRKSASGPVIELSYVEAARLEFSRIFGALSISPLDLQARTLRLHTADTLSRFAVEDHQAIRDELAQMGRSAWVSEEI